MRVLLLSYPLKGFMYFCSLRRYERNLADKVWVSIETLEKIFQRNFVWNRRTNVRAKKKTIRTGKNARWSLDQDTYERTRAPEAVISYRVSSLVKTNLAHDSSIRFSLPIALALVNSSSDVVQFSPYIVVSLTWIRFSCLGFDKLANGSCDRSESRRRSQIFGSFMIAPVRCSDTTIPRIITADV